MGNNYSSLSEEQLARIFKEHDQNKDGKLTKEELNRAFKYLRTWFSTFKANRALRAVDTNHDGIISLEEMSKLIAYVKGRHI